MGGPGSGRKKGSGGVGSNKKATPNNTGKWAIQNTINMRKNAQKKEWEKRNAKDQAERAARKARRLARGLK